ncbi:MAG: DedA family protein [Ktedonobacterales bacterium]
MNQLISGLAGIPPVAVFLFVFLWLALESAGAPVPNEVVLLLCGSLSVRHGAYFPSLLVIVATLGSLLGAFVSYTIGYRGGRPLVLRLGRRLRLDEKRLDAIELRFARSGLAAVFFARITPFVRTVASYPAGMLRLPLTGFLLVSAAGSLIWCSVMVGVGHAFGKNYQVALTFIEKYTVPAILVIVVLIAAYLWLHNRLAKAQSRSLSDEQLEALHKREQRQ